MTYERFRRIEFWAITGLTLGCLFVVLWLDFANYAHVFRNITVQEKARIGLRYNWWLNGFWPLVSIFLTVYCCWYALNRVIFPRYWPTQQVFLAIGWLLVGLVLLTGVWSYLYFWESLNFKYDVNLQPIGAKVKSLFRLRNLALLQAFVFFPLSLYSALSQLYQWCLQQTDKEAITVKIVKDGCETAFSGLIVLVLIEFFRERFKLEGFLFYIQTAFMHAYILHHGLLRGESKHHLKLLVFQKFKNLLFFSFVSSVILIIISSFFDYFLDLSNPHLFYYSFPIFMVFPLWLMSLVGAVGLAVIRQSITKPLETNLNRNRAELSALRAQINPHFLFNAMNTLYATAIEENAEKTSRGIQQLSDMMRFMMHENNQDQIDIRQEVAYLRNYVDLQRLRIAESDKFELKIELDDAHCLRSVAPMLLIPFIENAFKHGVSLRNQSWIFVKLYCNTDKLYFKVQNSLHPRYEADPEKQSSGIGLTNVQKRLELLYPRTHTLQIYQTEKEFSVHLEIDFSERGNRQKLDDALAKYDVK